MARSLHRRKLKIRRKKQQKVEPNGAVTASSKPIRISKHRFIYLRRDEDFVALVKMGRVVNAVAFAIELISGAGEGKNPVSRRQFHRAVFVAGGYVHEAIKVIESMRLRYSNEAAFKPLYELAFDDKFKEERKVLLAIRNSAGFHLDSHDATTKKMISQLPLQRYDLASGESDQVGHFYFDFADIVDINYLISALKLEGEDDDASFRRIYLTVSDFMGRFLKLGHEFLVAMADKIGLADHTE